MNQKIMMSTAKIRVNESLISLMKNFIDLFKITVGYVNKPATEDELTDLMEASKKSINDIWLTKTGLQTFKTAFETVLTTVHMTLDIESEEIKSRKKAFQNSYEDMAKNIIANYQHQMKQYFMSDLFSRADDDIKTEMLKNRIEPIHLYSGDDALSKLRDRIKSKSYISETEKCLKESYPRKSKLTDENIGKLHTVHEKVATKLNIPIVCLIQYRADKKRRNREVHVAEELIKKYLKQLPQEAGQNLEVADFLKYCQISNELPEFKHDEIQDLSQIFCNFVNFSKQGRKQQ